MKVLFVVLVALHALIHALGFVKAFGFADVSELTGHISRPVGLLWLTTTFMFLLAALLFAMDNEGWWMIGVTAVLLSQVLVIISWADARVGTIPNILITLVIVVSIGSYRLRSEFTKAVAWNLQTNSPQTTDTLTEADIAHLPSPVQRYVRYTGSVGRLKVQNFRAEFAGGIRSNPDEDLMPLSSTQYNFMSEPARLFHIMAKKMGVPATGLHLYQKQKATFQIKLLNWFTVVDAKGGKMDQGETVTVFNDMCCIAPATLIDKRIVWESVDELTARAVYTNGAMSVRATLFFNDRGELVNFVSNDRYETDGTTYSQYPWSTPVLGYKNVDGYRLPAKVKVVYTRPDGNFTYGEFELKNLKYNTELLER